MKYSEAFQARFWAKVDKTGDCWLWTASKQSGGYGQVGLNRISTLAHRVAWELTKGEIPKGLLVLHTCDIRTCVNPEHLWLGTHSDNTQDMLAKGRQPNGLANGCHVNTARIVELKAAGFSISKIVDKLGYNARTIVKHLKRNQQYGIFTGR